MAQMSMREFKAIVRRVMETLPPELLAHMENVVVDVDEKPSQELLLRAELTPQEIAEGESLLGLFDPLELPWGSDAVDQEDMMHRLWIFKDTHEEQFPEPAQLRIEIRKTVIHELAHHFGYTDRDLERFDNTPNPFGDATI